MEKYIKMLLKMTKRKSEIDILFLNYKTDLRQSYSEILVFKGI